jgi:hypothetical protein
MAIDALPTPPNRNMSPEQFIAAADAFIEALPTFQSQANAAAEAMNLNDTTSTSTTSVLIGTGAKSLTVQASKSYVPGMTVKIARTSDGTKWMVGDVTSYNSGTGALAVTVSKVQGSGTFTDWTISFASTEQIDDQFINGMTTVTPTLLDFAAIADESDSGNRKKALLSAIATLFNNSSVDRAVPVRQTVLSGPVDSNGLPSFGGSTGSTSVTMSGTLVVTAANGTSNRTGSGTNLSWTGLSTNGTMYLYVDIGSDGTLTPGAGTLAPTYRWGGADVTTNGQFTFNIQEMTGKVGNGSSAAQTHRVYVGEVTVAGGVVTAITWYALQGRAQIDSGSTLAVSTAFNFATNLGVATGIAVDFSLIVTTTTNGYAVGDEIRDIPNYGDGTNNRTYTVSITGRNSAQLATGPAILAVVPKTGGVQAAVTAANVTMRLTARRAW